MPTSSGAQSRTPNGVTNDICGVMRCCLPDTGRDSNGRGHYFWISVLACTLVAGGAIVTWSSMGFGRDSMTFFKANEGYSYIAGGIFCSLLLILYVFDFFFPLHLPGRNCLLFEGDRFVGPSLVISAGAALFTACLFYAKYEPSLPLIATSLLGPIFIFGIHAVMMPATKDRWNDDSSGKLEERMERLKSLCAEESKQRNFFAAASSAFVLTGLGCLAAWLPWAITRGHELDDMRHESAQGREELEVLYILWSAPLTMAVTDMIFGVILSLRVYMSRSYVAAHELRNKLVVEGYSAEGDARHKSTLLGARLTKTFEKGDQDTGGFDEAKKLEYLQLHIKGMRQLMQVVKIISCALILKIGATYVTFQLVAVDSHLASMIQNWLSAMFVFFVAFIFTAFRRLWVHLTSQFKDSSLFVKATEMVQSSWLRAMAVAMCSPVLPGIFVLSALNQFVRRRRGLLTIINPEVTQDNGHILTESVRKHLFALRQWEWIPIVAWVYTWCLVGLALMLSPLLLNVFLAALSHYFLDGLPYGLLLLITFLIGMCLFLLPPVPGAALYFFSGALFTKSCPWGFWAGALISIFMGWATKLAACALQQKGIGENLGDKLFVRQACGVHKPFIRTIERILSKRGLCIGKCAVLVGGPDWPVSVLAGILRLSLVQCEIGTLPIIFFIAPFSMSGSFYLKRDDGEVWNRAGTLMITLTAVVCVVLWGIMAWAWQKEFDENKELVTKPMEKYLQLDWLDYCADELRRKCDVSWSDMPFGVKLVFSMGAIVLIAVCHLFFWAPTMCFGVFAVTDDITRLRWTGSDDALLLLPGLIGLLAALLGYSGSVVFKSWWRQRTHGPLQKFKEELTYKEEEWKAARLKEIASLDEEVNGGRRASHDPTICPSFSEVGATAGFQPTYSRLTGDKAAASAPSADTVTNVGLVGLEAYSCSVDSTLEPKAASDTYVQSADDVRAEAVQAKSGNDDMSPEVGQPDVRPEGIESTSALSVAIPRMASPPEQNLLSVPAPDASVRQGSMKSMKSTASAKKGGKWKKRVDESNKDEAEPKGEKAGEKEEAEDAGAGDKLKKVRNSTVSQKPDKPSTPSSISKMRASMKSQAKSPGPAGSANPMLGRPTVGQNGKKRWGKKVPEAPASEPAADAAVPVPGDQPVVDLTAQ